jgi:hypothetical protein
MDFKKRMDDFIDKGIATSKELWGKAKDTARDLSQKGILTFEISQLERSAQAEMARLGSHVYDVLVNRKQQAIYPEEIEVKKLLDHIQEIRSGIESKEEELRKLRQKEG